MRSKFYFFVFFCACLFSCSDDASSGMDSLSGSGQGGSMTRFAIYEQYLYVLDNSAINVYDISEHKFAALGQVDVGQGMETIFAQGQYLYLGANNGMYIYSISNPELPVFTFRYEHIMACDPVVVQGNIAYVTMRNGTSCGGAINALDIIDITDRYNPNLIATHQMQNPHGLAVAGTTLFLCEGEFGLKVFDISDHHNIKLTTHVETVHAYDVIARSGILTMTGDDGIFQYSYESGDLLLKSKIPVTRTEL
jgi:hypothetical protein